MKRAVDCTVIGGGISGLVAAFDLAHLGKSVILLEASDHLGGLISSVDIAGVAVDCGAESFAVTQSATLDLLAELGLSDLVIEPSRSDSRIFADGREFQIPFGVMGIPADLSDPLLQRIIGTGDIALARELDAKPWNIVDEKSIGEIVEKRLGKVFVERIVNPIVAGVHASDSYQLEMASVLPELLAVAGRLGSLHLAAKQIRGSSGRPGSAVLGLKGGVHRLIEGLKLKLEESGVEIRTNVAAFEVAFDELHNQWLTISSMGEISSGSLVIAVPPDRSSELLGNFVELANSLKAINSVDVALVIMAIDRADLSDEPLGPGVLIAAEGSGISAKASTHATAKWNWLRESFGGNMEVIRLSYGRNGVLPVNVEELKNVAVADLEILYGLSNPKVVESKVVMWPRSLIQAGVGHGENLNRISTLVQELPGLAIVGAGLGGNGITGLIKKSREAVARLEKENTRNE